MAYSLVSSVSVGSPDGLNVTTAAIDTTGADFIVISSGYYEVASPALGVSDNKGNTYSGLTVRTVVGDGEVRLWYVANPTVGTGHTFSTTGASGPNPTYGAIVVGAFSGSQLTTPFDVQNGATTTGTSLATGSITPSADNELIIAGLSVGGTITNLAINSGLSIVAQVGYVAAQHYGTALAYLAQGTAAAINPTWSWTTSRSSEAAIASFKAAAGGGSFRISTPLSLGILRS